MTVNVVISNTAADIRALVALGFCPVECSIGGTSIVDALQMDHHGEFSHLESVALRAYRDHFGARAADPRFVLCGFADADATFAIAALAGIIPHPARKVSDNLPPPVKASMTRDLTALAETIAVLDTDPIGRDMAAMIGGDVKLVWEAMYGQNARDSLAATAAVAGWRTLTEGNPGQLKPFFDAAKAAEEERIAAAKTDMIERGSREGGVLLIDQSRVFGFDVWYGRQPDQGGPNDIAGWAHPIVVAHLERGGNVTLGCPNLAVAEALFGPGGLKNVFAKLQPEGWGGREAVGGSPRGVVLSKADVDAAIAVINAAMLA